METLKLRDVYTTDQGTAETGSQAASHQMQATSSGLFRVGTCQTKALDILPVQALGTAAGLP